MLLALVLEFEARICIYIFAKKKRDKLLRAGVEAQSDARVDEGRKAWRLLGAKKYEVHERFLYIYT